MNKRNLFSWTIVALFVCFVIFKTYDQKKNEEKIKENTKHTTGIIKYHRVDARNSAGWFEYQYSVNGKTYEGRAMDKGARRFTDGLQLFINSRFLVIYDATDPSNSDLLIAPKDYEKYDIVFPDSLVWVEKYIDDEYK